MPFRFRKHERHNLPYDVSAEVIKNCVKYIFVGRCLLIFLTRQFLIWYMFKTNNVNKGNAKSGISPRLKIWPSDLDLWPWKSIGFQILLRTKYVPSLVKIHWKMLILVFTGYYVVKIWPSDLDLWHWKSIRFQILLRTKYVPSLVKIHWRMLILVCSQGCYAVKIWPGDLDLWSWKSIGFQILF